MSAVSPDSPAPDPGAPATWREAFLRSPGPRSWPAAAALYIKGLLMGAADIVPGVSGGTIAFVTGIYDDFVNAVASFDAAALAAFCRGAWKRALGGVHLRFLLCLAAGIVTAIFALSGVIQTCMEKYPVPTWSLFFGLILGSAVVIFREVPRWSLPRVLLVLAGAAAAWWVCGLIPVSTPETLPFYFFCGAVAICAMALPGISGSFLLLVLGKYYPVIAAVHAVKNAVKAVLGGDLAAASAILFDPAARPFWILVCLALGQVCGLVCFSRFLKWLLARWHAGTMCVLAGMMLGALRRIWPWKQAVRIDCLHEGGLEKVKIIEERLVGPGAFAREYAQAVTDRWENGAAAVREAVAPGADPQVALAVALMVAGAALVLAVEWLAKGKRKEAA